MEFPKIATTEELRAFMQKCDTDVVTDDRLIWFVCIQEARALSDSGTLKDVAALFKDGVTAVDMPYVQQWIDTHYEDMDEACTKLESLYIIRAIFNFYGYGDNIPNINQMAIELEQQIEALE